MEPLPSKIDRLSPTEMRIDWSHHESFGLPYLELRAECPCAVCVDEHTGKRLISKEKLDPAVRPLAVHLVGRYAVQIDWSDRHSTGMVHFDRLYALCLSHGKRLDS